MSVVIYTNPTCQPCRQTKRAFQAKGIDFKEIDLSKNPDALEELVKYGHRSVPVVVVSEDTHWSGYEPEKIAAL